MKYLAILPLLLAFSIESTRAEQLYYYGPHLTAQPPWINTITVYNNGIGVEYFELTVWNQQGVEVNSAEIGLWPFTMVKIVFPADPGYRPGPDDRIMKPIEGTFVIRTSSMNLRPKLSYRYGSSESLCEFFLQEGLGHTFVLSNSGESHFDWTGVAVMNPTGSEVRVFLGAYRNNSRVGEKVVRVGPRTKYVELSTRIWPKLRIADFDQIEVSSTVQAIAPPLSITGNDAQTRHVFFLGASTNRSEYVDEWAGNFRLVPAGGFIQGSLLDEPGRTTSEETRVPLTTSYTGLFAPYPVRHVLTRNILVMETEVTQEMWSGLKAAQPGLPNDPSRSIGFGPRAPVNRVTWFETILFANLLSTQTGLPPCYYTNSGLSAAINPSNYLGGQYYFDINCKGYRLPTEGEWEYFARAGTATPFYIDEPLYDDKTYSACTRGLFKFLEKVAIFCANNPGGPMVVASREPNAWGLYDIHGNVAEWCWDWFDSPYPALDMHYYCGPNSGTQRVFRGGGWSWGISLCRSAARSFEAPGTRFDTIGFRLVRTLSQNY